MKKILFLFLILSFGNLYAQEAEVKALGELVYKVNIQNKWKENSKRVIERSVSMWCSKQGECDSSNTVAPMDALNKSLEEAEKSIGLKNEDSESVCPGGINYLTMSTEFTNNCTLLTINKDHSSFNQLSTMFAMNIENTFNLDVDEKVCDKCFSSESRRDKRKRVELQTKIARNLNQASLKKELMRLGSQFEHEARFNSVYGEMNKNKYTCFNPEAIKEKMITSCTTEGTALKEALKRFSEALGDDSKYSIEDQLKRLKEKVLFAENSTCENGKASIETYQKKQASMALEKGENGKDTAFSMKYNITNSLIDDLFSSQSVKDEYCKSKTNGSPFKYIVNNYKESIKDTSIPSKVFEKLNKQIMELYALENESSNKDQKQSKELDNESKAKALYNILAASANSIPITRLMLTNQKSFCDYLGEKEGDEKFENLIRAGLDNDISDELRSERISKYSTIAFQESCDQIIDSIAEKACSNNSGKNLTDLYSKDDIFAELKANDDKGVNNLNTEALSCKFSSQLNKQLKENHTYTGKSSTLAGAFKNRELEGSDYSNFVFSNVNDVERTNVLLEKQDYGNICLDGKSNDLFAMIIRKNIYGEKVTDEEINNTVNESIKGYEYIFEDKSSGNSVANSDGKKESKPESIQERSIASSGTEAEEAPKVESRLIDPSSFIKKLNPKTQNYNYGNQNTGKSVIDNTEVTKENIISKAENNNQSVTDAPSSASLALQKQLEELSQKLEMLTLKNQELQSQLKDGDLSKASKEKLETEQEELEKAIAQTESIIKNKKSELNSISQKEIENKTIHAQNSENDESVRSVAKSSLSGTSRASGLDNESQESNSQTRAGIVTNSNTGIKLNVSSIDDDAKSEILDMPIEELRKIADYIQGPNGELKYIKVMGLTNDIDFENIKDQELKDKLYLAIFGTLPENKEAVLKSVNRSLASKPLEPIKANNGVSLQNLINDQNKLLKESKK